MFTGLIKELATVKILQKQRNSYKLTINSEIITKNLKIGESIAVSGVCLTVVDFSSKEFTVDVMPETSKSTIIDDLKSGDKVNLEKTLTLKDGLDGHIVSGHVDSIGVITKKTVDEIAQIFHISTKSSAMKYIIKKGSICVDGISLTVVSVANNSFVVSLIPHTAKMTTLGYKNVGDKVNLETDIIGKYVERLLEFKINKNDGIQESKSKLTKEKLFENGFL